ncbi:hypothetical protein DESUT3_08240 [Desulfuromonas versatilis]|uniref:tRNA-dihydrouridine synthase n=1 Tax=Desulfuromonas versatilis TaxID=2802975 RepID=A0ABN6DUG1_9BACT|nr:tRNA-dihydrouridine synthase family protein [Desulfuromonas versatilis]BCR03755.1 hypothetical protein DESUT3_08240 [Desulfuromonas versatilis]
MAVKPHADSAAALPWNPASQPLMLAPMQGLTNRALRGVFVDWVRPDVVFTEFIRVNAGTARGLKATDRKEAADRAGGVPLVVQLIGRNAETLVPAALAAQQAGAEHLNLNMGCPFGRMTPGSAGGGMLKTPENIPEILRQLRLAISGSFSVKIRAGYENPQQIFELLPVIEAAGVDFLVLHPRTVLQKYSGRAEHGITARVVAATRLPVIANGDIDSAESARRVAETTGAAGLMLGRAAIADPLLFQRIRGQAAAEPSAAERRAELARYLGQLLERYAELFCGDTQVLRKLKEALAFHADPRLREAVTGLRRAKSLAEFSDRVQALGG